MTDLCCGRRNRRQFRAPRRSVLCCSGPRAMRPSRSPRAAFQTSSCTGQWTTRRRSSVSWRAKAPGTPACASLNPRPSPTRIPPGRAELLNGNALAAVSASLIRLPISTLERVLLHDSLRIESEESLYAFLSGAVMRVANQWLAG
jgi:hypothetical protein